jgi:fatty acid desaturase
MGKERLQRYSLAGPENRAAADAGLAGADWFRSDVPRKRMKELMRRSDYPAIRDTAIWLGLILLSGGLAIAFWGTWWALPKALGAPVLADLRTYPVKLENGTVYIDVGPVTG